MEKGKETTEEGKGEEELPPGHISHSKLPGMSCFAGCNVVLRRRCDFHMSLAATQCCLDSDGGCAMRERKVQQGVEDCRKREAPKMAGSGHAHKPRCLKKVAPLLQKNLTELMIAAAMRPHSFPLLLAHCGARRATHMHLNRLTPTPSPHSLSFFSTSDMDFGSSSTRHVVGDRGGVEAEVGMVGSKMGEYITGAGVPAMTAEEESATVTQLHEKEEVCAPRVYVVCMSEERWVGWILLVVVAGGGGGVRGGGVGGCCSHPRRMVCRAQ